MITIQPDYDLSLLAEHFTECGDYTKDVILEEVEYYQKLPDFFVLISGIGDSIDGFMIGYRNRNSLWLSQVWRKSGTDTKTSRYAFEIAKEWAKARDLTSITGETKRSEMRAMERYGWQEYSVNMICRL